MIRTTRTAPPLARRPLWSLASFSLSTAPGTAAASQGLELYPETLLVALGAFVWPSLSGDSCSRLEWGDERWGLVELTGGTRGGGGATPRLLPNVNVPKLLSTRQSPDHVSTPPSRSLRPSLFIRQTTQETSHTEITSTRLHAIASDKMIAQRTAPTDSRPRAHLSAPLVLPAPVAAATAVTLLVRTTFATVGLPFTPVVETCSV